MVILAKWLKLAETHHVRPGVLWLRQQILQVPCRIFPGVFCINLCMRFRENIAEIPRHELVLCGAILTRGNLEHRQEGLHIVLP